MIARPPRLHRRDVLKGAGAAALASAPLTGCGRRGSSLAVAELGKGLVMIAGAGGNVVAVRGSEGAVLIDSGSAEHADEVLRAVRDAFGQRDVAALFTTHWHLDHAGGNALLGARGVKIIAHENTRLWMGTTIYRRWEEKTYPPAPEAARPTDTFYTSGEATLGGEKIRYGHLRLAHTDGDMTVAFPDRNVIVAGGIVSNAGWPVIDWSTGGWFGGMTDALKALIDLSDDGAIIVPSDGPPMRKADLERQHAMYTTILDRMAKMLKLSYGPDEVAAAKPTAEFDAEMGDPTLFVRLAFESFWGHLRSDRRVSSF
jgi:glyoxylase-like metal-dependent hydrolase (beta-lactamase superfamily II)